MATARRQRVRAGMTFYHVYADGNVKWEVVRRDGQQTWLCRSTDDNLDWGGMVKAFTSADILRSVNMDAFWSDRLNDCDVWYQSQEPGTIVHYHNSFGQYVRCEVIRLEEDHTMRTGMTYKKGEIALRPIALVGQWRTYDLPHRRRDGEIRLPYHAEKILEGNDIMKPDYKCIFEANPERLLDKHGDPRDMEAIDLTVPDMTPEEQVIADRWKLVDKIKESCDQRTDDPNAILINIGAMLGTVPGF